MSLVVNSFQLLPLDIHKIIRNFVSVEDCVSMCKVSHCLNTIWKNFTNDTPERRNYILAYIRERSPRLEQNRTLIEMVMSPLFFEDLANVNQIHPTIFKNEMFHLLSSVLFSMTDFIHLHHFLTAMKKFAKVDFEDTCMSICKHINNHGHLCWNVELLIDVIKMVAPLEKDLVKSESPVDYIKIFKVLMNDVKKVRKLIINIPVGDSYYFGSQQALYKKLFEAIAHDISTDSLVYLVRLAKKTFLADTNIVTNLFASIFESTNATYPHDLNPEFKKASAVWQTLPTKNKKVVLEKVIQIVANNCVLFAEYLWNEQATLEVKLHPLSTKEVYLLLTKDRRGKFFDSRKYSMNWIHRRLGPIYTISMLGKAVKHLDVDLTRILLCHLEIDVNAQHHGQTPIRRVMNSRDNFSSSERTDIFLDIFNHPAFDWESNIQEILFFFENKNSWDLHIPTIVGRSRLFNILFNYERLQVDHFSRRGSVKEYRVFLRNLRKKQKVENHHFCDECKERLQDNSPGFTYYKNANVVICYFCRENHCNDVGNYIACNFFCKRRHDAKYEDPFQKIKNGNGIYCNECQTSLYQKPLGFHFYVNTRLTICNNC